jgi:YVTN family beta-propeller protein
VIELRRALSGDRTAEILRIPTQIGPWGIAASPNGRYIVAANRESQRVAFEGNTISIIDVDRIEAARAANDPRMAEVARVLVGTSNPTVQTRPFIPSFTPDGKQIVVPNFRSNNVSIVDLAKALANDPGAEVARIPIVRPAEPDGVVPVRASRPKGSAVTADGRYAVISAGPRVTLNPFIPTGTVSIIDLKTRSVVATVTGVGNDPYGLALVERSDDDD